MNEYIIITDSTADLPADLVCELSLTVLPLEFTIDGKTYKDDPLNPGLSSKSFYDMLRSGKMSRTSQINTNTFTECFGKFLDEGRDVLYVAFSSALSGIYQSACIAADELREKYPDNKIVIVDTLSASLGEGLLVYHAANMKANGADIDTVAGWLEENKLKMCHWFTVDDLNHLKRGGRISSATALIGSLLGIKPVLRVNDEGKLVPVTTVRGRKQSLDALVDRIAKTCVNPTEQTVFISHGDVIDDAEYVKSEIIRRVHAKAVKFGNVGPVVGSHSGPGTIAVFFFSENRNP
jgi:DegV family protein with EDD domain